MQREITRFSQRLRGIFEAEAANIELPNFIHFPKNCCQLASLYLGVLINARFPTAHIELIHGCNKLMHENHYWLVVNGFSYDITADQFDGVNMPLYAGLSNPLMASFSTQQSTELMLAFNEYNKLDKEKKLTVLDELEYLLAQPCAPY
ncbi:hypothetical protein HWQ46_19220 [Shewanella sp. D64]|uniref:hypothetical protein n=1 Tax=unclassified Shewanella TaxID=196818 RepID=UPI0022BA1973|nr:MULTISPECIES: hypothetical protein [unclassified Shewanella]MEC4727680.1 hypothetical protein [Shewanella sp. D64]MEC4739747.1 hypothetical protein [Shewanella sp. E94]WBJ94076.1 hypothetical protein HWQ47_19535 [Shewanella sp. MTB7]